MLNRLFFIDVTIEILCFYEMKLPLVFFRIIMESQPLCNNLLLTGCILCCLSLLLLGLPARGFTVPKQSFTLLCHVSSNLSKFKMAVIVLLSNFQFLVANITFNGWFLLCLWINVFQSLGCSPARHTRESASRFQASHGPGLIIVNLHKLNSAFSLNRYQN